MCDVIPLKEALSKIESLAGAALYLTTSEEEHRLQTELISLIEEIACVSSSPTQEAKYA